jgi:hypothetical protein
MGLTDDEGEECDDCEDDDVPPPDDDVAAAAAVPIAKGSVDATLGFTWRKSPEWFDDKTCLQYFDRQENGGATRYCFEYKDACGKTGEVWVTVEDVLAWPSCVARHRAKLG